MSIKYAAYRFVYVPETYAVKNAFSGSINAANNNKKIFLFDRRTGGLLSTGTPESDGTFFLECPYVDDGQILAVCTDEDGNYNADVYDRVSLCTTQYPYGDAFSELSNDYVRPVEDIREISIGVDKLLYAPYTFDPEEFYPPFSSIELIRNKVVYKDSEGNALENFGLPLHDLITTNGGATLTEFGLHDERKITQKVANIVDILGDGSCVAYYPLFSDFSDRSGVNEDISVTVTADIGYDARVEIPYRYFSAGGFFFDESLINISTGFTLSFNTYHLVDYTNWLVYFTTPSGVFAVGYDTTNITYIRIYVAGSYRTQFSGVSQEAEHITVTYAGTANGNAITVYKNGSSVGTYTLSLGSNPTQARVGYQRSVGHFRIFNRALTSTEVATVYNDAYYSIYDFTDLKDFVFRSHQIVDEQLKLVIEANNSLMFHMPLKHTLDVKYDESKKTKSLYITNTGFTLYEDRLNLSSALFRGISATDTSVNLSFGNESAFDACFKLILDNTDNCVIWKSGDATNGIAIGVLSGDICVYAANAGTITSITVDISGFDITAGIFYIIFTGFDTLSVYDIDFNLIASNTGTLSVGTVTAQEAIGAASGGSPLTGITTELLEGTLYDFDFFNQGEFKTLPTTHRKFVAYDTDFLNAYEIVVDPYSYTGINDTLKLYVKIPELNSVTGSQFILAYKYNTSDFDTTIEGDEPELPGGASQARIDIRTEAENNELITFSTVQAVVLPEYCLQISPMDNSVSGDMGGIVLPIYLDGTITSHLDVFDSLTPLSVLDSFEGTDGDIPNPSLWTVSNSVISSNKARATSNGSLITKYYLSGNFDVQVDITLTNTPAATDWLINLRAMFSNGQQFSVNLRESGSTRGWWALRDDSYVNIANISATGQTSGKLRLIRSGTTLTFQYYISSWVTISTYTVPSVDAKFLLGAFSWNTASNIIADFDNFTVNSGTIVWDIPTQLDLRIGNTTTSLPLEIVYWDADNKKAQINFTAPEIVQSSAFRLYYDPSSADNSVRDNVDDDFTGEDGDVPNTDLWVTTGPAQINSNSLLFSVDSDNSSATVESVYKLIGDFSVDVKHTVVTAPTNCVWNIMATIDANNYAIIQQISTTTLRFRWIKDGGTLGNTQVLTLSQGFRFTRTDDAFSGYYWNGSSWVQIGTAQTIYDTPVTIKLGLITFTDFLDASIRFDDFVVNSADAISGNTGAPGSPQAQQIYDSKYAFAAWNSQDPSGTAPQMIDSTSYAMDGTSNGTMTSGDLVDIGNNYGVELDGVDDYINFGYNAAHDLIDTLTVMAFVKPTATLNSTSVLNFVSVIDRKSSTEDTYSFGINGDGKLHLGSSGGNIQSTTAEFAANTNFFLSGTYNYNSGTPIGDLFINGTKETLSVDSYDAMAGATTDLIVGYCGSSGDYLPSAVGFVAILNEIVPDYVMEVMANALEDSVWKFSSNLDVVYSQIELDDNYSVQMMPVVGTVDSTLNDVAIPLYLDGNVHGEIFDMLTPSEGISDDFTGDDGDPPNTLLWERWIDSSGDAEADTYELQSNRLFFSFTAISRVQFRSRFMLSGDFDVQIDFGLIVYPSTNLWLLNFMATTTDNLGDDYFQIDRRYSSFHQYFLQKKIAGTMTSSTVTTSDSSGKFRLVRIGSTGYAYHWDGSGWVLDLTATGISEDDMYILLYARVTASSFSCSSYLDNFVVNSGTVIWPTIPKKLALKVRDTDYQLPLEGVYWDSVNRLAQFTFSDPFFKQGSYYTITADPTSKDQDFLSTIAECNDDFSGPNGYPPNKALWNPVSGSSNQYLYEGKYRNIITAATGSRNTWSRFNLTGNFDIQVSYTIVSNPATNVWAMQFGIKNINDYTDFMYIDRRYSSGNYYLSEIYTNGSPRDSDTISTSDTSGKLRLVRTGSVATCYRWSGTAWVAMSTYSSFVTDDVILIFTLVTTSSMTVVVDIDDFIINSGTISANIPAFYGNIGTDAAKKVYATKYKSVLWPQDPNGTVYDSVTGNALAISGSMADLSIATIGRAFTFDGVDDVIDLGISTQYTDFTLEAYFMTPGIPAGVSAKILNNIGYYADATTSFPAQLTLGGTEVPSFVLSIGDDYTADRTLTTDSVDLNKYHLLIGSNDADGVAAMFLNGELVDSSTGVTVSDSSLNWKVGRASYPYSSGAGYEQFTGDIAYTAIKNTPTLLEEASVLNYGLRNSLWLWGVLMWDVTSLEPTAWFDAKDTSLITFATGVYSWTDKTGNSNNAIQTTAAKQPAYDYNKMGLYFDGVDDSLSMTINETTDDWNIFIVYDPVNVSNTVGEYLIDTNGSDRIIFAHLTYYTTTPYTYTGYYHNSIWTHAASAVSGKQILHFSLQNSVGNVYRNGTLVGSGSYTQIGISSPCIIGGNYTDSAAYFKGWMYEILFFKGEMVSESIDKVIGYLSWKWQLEDSIDASNPYSDYAPFVNPYATNIPSFLSGFNVINCSISADSIDETINNEYVPVLITNPSGLNDSDLFADIVDSVRENRVVEEGNIDSYRFGISRDCMANFNGSNLIFLKRVDGAIVFSGSSTRWLTLNGINFNQTDYTISFWHRSGTFDSTARWIFSDGISGSTGQNNIYFSNAYIYARSNSQSYYNTTIHEGYKWEHLAVVFNHSSNTFYYYKNGAYYGSSSTGSETYLANDKICLGGMPSGNGYIGYVKDLSIHSTALNATQIAAIYTYGPATVMYDRYTTSYFLLDSDDFNLFEDVAITSLGLNITQGDAFISLTFDNLTYSVANTTTTLVPIVSFDPNVHGNTGDNSLYYYDGINWIAYTESYGTGASDIKRALSLAMSYRPNSDRHTGLFTFTNFDDYVPGDGIIGICVTSLSLVNETTPIITDITVNDLVYQFSNVYPLDEAGIVTDSNIKWYSFKDTRRTDSLIPVVEVSLDGDPNWTVCNYDEPIPVLTNGVDYSGRSMRFRVTWHTGDYNASSSKYYVHLDFYVNN